MKKVIIAFLLSVTPTHLLANNGKYADSNQCTDLMPQYERMLGIPANLLYSIAQNESGVWNNSARKVTPWPWTLGVEGRGMYFKTEAEAVVALQKLVKSGVRNIDVGCMQVNMMHHPSAFPSIASAFRPENNVSYAARFLRDNYNETRSWRAAVAYYHSRTSSFGTPYSNRVINSWIDNMGYTHLKKLPVAGATISSPKVTRTAKLSKNQIKKVNTQLASYEKRKSKTRRDGAVIQVVKNGGSSIKIVRMQPVTGAGGAEYSENTVAQKASVIRGPKRGTPVDFIFN